MGMLRTTTTADFRPEVKTPPVQNDRRNLHSFTGNHGRRI